MSANSVILVSGSYDHTIRFWEALSGICSKTIQYADSQVNRLCISPDKRFLAAGGHGNVKLYDINSNSPGPVMTFEGHTGNITAVGFHCEGKWMVTSSEDGTVKIWDTRTPTVQRNYDHGAPVNDVVIHPNQGELISCDAAGKVMLWDLAENKCSHQMEPDEQQRTPLRSVTVANDGTMVVAGDNKGSCYVWKMTNHRDVTSMQPVHRFAAHSKYLLRCLLSPDVRSMATCSADTTVKIWNTDGWTLDKQLHGHQRWVWDCAFSADSAYLVTASSDHIARLWELSSGETIRQYNGHHKAAVCVALNDYNLDR